MTGKEITKDVNSNLRSGTRWIYYHGCGYRINYAQGNFELIEKSGHLERRRNHGGSVIKFESADNDGEGMFIKQNCRDREKFQKRNETMLLLSRTTRSTDHV